MSEIQNLDNQQATWKIAWLAGIWDGEGTISVCRAMNRTDGYAVFRPRIQMVNSNPAIIRESADILKKIGINPHIQEKGMGGFEGSRKQCWNVVIHTLVDCAKFIDIVAPYLIGKREQALLLKRFIDSRIERRMKVKRNSDCKYSKDELEFLAQVCELNGNIHGASETIRAAAAKIAA